MATQWIIWRISFLVFCCCCLFVLKENFSALIMDVWQTEYRTWDAACWVWGHLSPYYHWSVHKCLFLVTANVQDALLHICQLSQTSFQHMVTSATPYSSLYLHDPSCFLALKSTTAAEWLMPHCSITPLFSGRLGYNLIVTSQSGCLWLAKCLHWADWLVQRWLAGHREVRAPLVMLGYDACVPYMMITVLNLIICPSQWGLYSFNPLNS